MRVALAQSWPATSSTGLARRVSERWPTSSLRWAANTGCRASLGSSAKRPLANTTLHARSAAPYARASSGAEAARRWTQRRLSVGAPATSYARPWASRARARQSAERVSTTSVRHSAARSSPMSARPHVRSEDTASRMRAAGIPVPPRRTAIKTFVWTARTRRPSAEMASTRTVTVCWTAPIRTAAARMWTATMAMSAMGPTTVSTGSATLASRSHAAGTSTATRPWAVFLIPLHRQTAYPRRMGPSSSSRPILE